MRGLDALLFTCTGRRWGTIVWGGVGYGADIAAVRALDARRCVYLEPNTELRARFSQKYAFSERETLSGTALSSATGLRPLHVLSDPLKSSLIPPDEVLKDWPNLRKVAQYDVQTQSLEALVAAHEISSEDHNLLVLDVCGAEREVLAAADEALLARFTHIVISHAQAATGDDPEWLQLLSRRGYEVHYPVDIATGGWVLLRRNQLAVEVVPPAEPTHVLQIREMEAELERAHARESAHAKLLDKTEGELQQSTQRATQLETELQQFAQLTRQLEIGLQEAAQNAIHLDSELKKAVQRAAQLDAELQQSVQRTARSDTQLQQATQRAAQLETEQQQSSQRTTQLESELQEAAQHAIHLDSELQKSVQRAAQLGAELQQSAQRAARSDAELQQAAQRATQLETKLQESAQRITQLEIGLQESAQHALDLDSELQEAMQRAAQLDAALQQAGQRTTQLEANVQQSAQRMEQLDADLQQTRQTMRMAVQMQAQRDADLADLQARYRDGQGALERQQALLDKLGERLGPASDYFHQLLASTENGHPELERAKLQGTSGELEVGTLPRGRAQARKAVKPKSRS